MFGGLRGAMQQQPGGQPGGQQPGICDRCAAWLKSIPIVTVTIVCINFFIYILTLLFDNMQMDLAICPGRALSADFTGIFTSPWVHVSFIIFMFRYIFCLTFRFCLSHAS